MGHIVAQLSLSSSLARRYHCQAHATHAHAHAHAHDHADHAVLPDVHAPVAHAPIENLFK